jgi:hypothetical protein
MALYETGGLYIDVDLGVRHSFWKSIQPTTEFVTPFCLDYSGFFQAFIAVTQYHPVIERYIRLFYDFYKGALPNWGEVLRGHKGVILLKRAYDQILFEQQEEKFEQQKHHHQIHTNFTTEEQTTHLSNTSELWHEILYDEKIFPYVVRPSWGETVPCQVVVSTKSLEQLANSSTSSTAPAYDDATIVPAYSRIAYSSRCLM